MTKEQYLLIQLMSECCEVAHRASKILHFGMDEIQPEVGVVKGSNNIRLNIEVNDLLATLELLRDEYKLIFIIDNDLISLKKEKVTNFMKYSEELGIVKLE